MTGKQRTERRGWRLTAGAAVSGAIVLAIFMSPLARYRLPKDESLLAESPDGRWLATVTWRPPTVVKDGTEFTVVSDADENLHRVGIRNARTGRLVRSLGVIEGVLSEPAFSRDGAYFAANVDGRARFWSTESGQPIELEGEAALFDQLPLMVLEDGTNCALLIDAQDPVLGTRYIEGTLKVLSLPDGVVVGEVGPIAVREPFWTSYSGRTFAVSSRGDLAVTFEVPFLQTQPPKSSSSLADSAPGFETTAWELPAGRRRTVLRESHPITTAGVDSENQKLWLVVRETSDSQPTTTGPLALHGWDIEQGVLRQEIPIERSSQSELIFGNASGLGFYGSSLARVHTMLGTGVCELQEDRLRWVGNEGLGTVFSDDGKLFAKEEGEVVDAAPPFVYQIRDRHLAVRESLTDRLVAKVNAKSTETTAVNQFSPIGFSSDGQHLVYLEFCDSTWAEVRAFAMDLLQFQLPALERRPHELRCLELSTGRSRLIGVPPRGRIGGDYVTNGGLAYQGNGFYSLQPSRPWGTILLFTLVLAGISILLRRPTDWALAILFRPKTRGSLTPEASEDGSPRPVPKASDGVVG